MADHIKVRATLETRKSNKTGKDYKAVILNLGNGYEKIVFLDRTEIYMLEGIEAQKEIDSGKTILDEE